MQKWLYSFALSLVLICDAMQQHSLEELALRGHAEYISKNYSGSLEIFNSCYQSIWANQKLTWGNNDDSYIGWVSLYYKNICNLRLLEIAKKKKKKKPSEESLAHITQNFSDILNSLQSHREDQNYGQDIKSLCKGSLSGLKLLSNRYCYFPASQKIVEQLMKLSHETDDFTLRHEAANIVINVLNRMLNPSQDTKIKIDELKWLQENRVIVDEFINQEFRNIYTALLGVETLKMRYFKSNDHLGECSSILQSVKAAVASYPINGVLITNVIEMQWQAEDVKAILCFEQKNWELLWQEIHNKSFPEKTPFRYLVKIINQAQIDDTKREQLFKEFVEFVENKSSTVKDLEVLKSVNEFCAIVYNSEEEKIKNKWYPDVELKKQELYARKIADTSFMMSTIYGNIILKKTKNTIQKSVKEQLMFDARHYLTQAVDLAEKFAKGPNELPDKYMKCMNLLIERNNPYAWLSYLTSTADSLIKEVYPEDKRKEIVLAMLASLEQALVLRKECFGTMICDDLRFTNAFAKTHNALKKFENNTHFADCHMLYREIIKTHT